MSKPKVLYESIRPQVGYEDREDVLQGVQVVEEESGPRVYTAGSEDLLHGEWWKLDGPGCCYVADELLALSAQLAAAKARIAELESAPSYGFGVVATEDGDDFPAAGSFPTIREIGHWLNWLVPGGGALATEPPAGHRIVELTWRELPADVYQKEMARDADLRQRQTEAEAPHVAL